MPDAPIHPGDPQRSLQVDLEKLAEKVYQLLLADTRLGRARGDSPLLPQRKGEG